LEQPNHKQGATKKAQMKTMEVINAHAAALDIGSEKIHGSVAGGAPRVFGIFTGELYALRDWLKSEAVETVATGVHGRLLADGLLRCSKPPASKWW
jgi:hypothetical protein